MVVHTDKFDKVVRAVKTVNKNVGRLYEISKEKDFTMFITAAHDNFEVMEDDKGEIITAHTTIPIPFIIIDYNIKEIETGKLGDIAPTILKYMDIEKSEDMTGNNLI